MNEIPFTRSELRQKLAEELAAVGVTFERPVFWEQNHTYCISSTIDHPNMEQGDLWLYYNREAMQSLTQVVTAAFSYIKFKPAVTESSAAEARIHLMNAYTSDELGIRTFLTTAQPPYLDSLIRVLCDAESYLTPANLHDALQALFYLGKLLSKQPVPSIFA